MGVSIEALIHTFFTNNKPEREKKQTKPVAFKTFRLFNSFLFLVAVSFVVEVCEKS